MAGILGRRPFFDRHAETIGREEPRFAARREDTWDFMTDKEVHRKFWRILYDTDVKGALTVSELERRIKTAAEMVRFLGERGYMDAKKAKIKADNLEKLIGTGFAPRVISLARNHPQGIINMTLNFGQEAAIRRKMELEKRLSEMLRTRRQE